MTNLDIIARMAMNGWPLIPAVSGQKQTFYRWGEVKSSSYNFGETFKGQPIDTNCAVLCDDAVIVVDFDNHGAEPNGATVYRWLNEMLPELFRNCIVEVSQSGGYHVYYRGPGKFHKVPFKIMADDHHENDITIDVEILAGRRLSYCWPTIVTGKGRYVVISQNDFFNTKPEDLPELPAIFQAKEAEKEKKTYTKELKPGKTRSQLSREDLEAIITGVIQAYAKNARNGSRHIQCQAMARHLAGYSIVSSSDVYDAVRAFASATGWHDTEKGELENIADYAIDHPDNDSEEYAPWTTVIQNRRKQAMQQYHAKRATGVVC